MSKYNKIGGIRLSHSGRVSKKSLLNELKIALNSLVDDFDLESFSGANCGYVYRASLKNPNNGKVSEIRIYDNNFHLIASVS